MNQRNLHGTAQRSRGFSTLELLLVMVVSLVIAALAIPGFNQVRRTLRISGDGRELNGAINQANRISQGPRCLPVNGRRLGQLATTACITFNSRGVAIDTNTGAPTGNDAVYITDNAQVYAVTVGATGMSQVWANNVNVNANWYRK